MPKKIPEYLNYFLDDCLQGDRQFTKKNMFGGYAIYKNGKVFSLFLMDTIYFKVDDNNRADYEEKNSKPFSYTKKSGQVGVMSYRELPEEILENREQLAKWIEKSLAVKAKAKPKKKSKKDVELDKAILDSLLEIPKQKVTTYQVLADKFGVHSRRIASVMKMNQHPDIYPCYKVISHSGKIGGYSGPDGVDAKLQMIEADGTKVIDGKVRKEDIYLF